MKVYQLRREQWLDLTREELFPFFADAGNLEAITPPWLGFRILTPRPIEMRAGTLIDYSLRLHGIPLRWRTRITEWNPPFDFVDEQLSGPYRLWRHRHEFETRGERTLMRDTVDYALPLGPLGRFAHWAWVRRDLDTIFDFRFARVAELLARTAIEPSAASH